MTQAHLNQANFKLKKNIQTQTGEKELFITLENKKTARVYFSTSYNCYVLGLNFGTSKTFILTKNIWNKLKKESEEIDKILNNDNSR
jgi:hypothetical protein